ncbi:Actin- protein 6 [Tilletia horrida]|uniref:Actin- protein 6 n=1 Tax=Tilletia horrida TaxID=155126 RepID=A0AAN6GR17_9BASI|nr:Actin- protein 6 [Tilletia horrida]KAK0565764.1 Actin- protein 6 [Tilletia horrida]
MVLLKAAPRRAAGYALLEIGAASLRVSLPDELPELEQDQDPLNERPTKKQKIGTAGDIGAGNASTADAVSPAAAPGATAVPLQDPKTSTVAVDDELPSVHSTSRTGARVTSSTAATAPADPNEPLHCMPNLIARARAPSSTSSASSASRRIYVGDQLLNECSDYSSLHLRSPIDRGIVTDWAAQKVLVDRAISVALANRSLVPRQPLPYTAAVAAKAARNSGLPATHVSFFEIGTDLESRLLEERTVIVTEAYFNFPDAAAMTDTMLFEQYGAAAIWRTTPAQLVPFAPIFGQSSAKTKSKQSAASLHPHNTTKLSVPDCLLVVDLGHSSTHVVPLICAQAQWYAARRLDVGGKLLTNLLKETLSFRQWDVMNEAWLIQAVKEKCCFLAPTRTMLSSESDAEAQSILPSNLTIVSATSDASVARRRRTEVLRLLRSVPPRHWGYSLLLEICKLFPASNPIVQDYALPDYSEPSSNNRKKKNGASSAPNLHLLGFIRRGPNADAFETPKATLPARGRNARSFTSAPPPQAEDNLVADRTLPCERKALRQRKSGKSSHLSFFLNAVTESDDSDDAPDSDDDEDFDPSKARKHSRKGRDAGEDDIYDIDDDESASSAEDEDDHESTEDDKDPESEAQFLKMGNERFCIPEILFAPGQVGLAQAPLHETITDAIRACPEDIQGMMWSNIVLVGGGAKLPGLRKRLENELRPLAPDNVNLHFWECEEPETVAARGALSLLSSRTSSAESRFLRAHLVNRTEWLSAGAAVCRARFGGWMAMHDASAHVRKSGDSDEEDDFDEGDDEPADGPTRPKGGQPHVLLPSALSTLIAQAPPKADSTNRKGKAREKRTSDKSEQPRTKRIGRPPGSGKRQRQQQQQQQQIQVREPEQSPTVAPPPAAS